MSLRRFVSSFYGVALVVALGAFVIAGALRATPPAHIHAGLHRRASTAPAAAAAIPARPATPRLDVYFVCSDAEKAQVESKADPAHPLAVVVYESISGVHDEMREQVDDWTETGEIGTVHLSNCP